MCNFQVEVLTTKQICSFYSTLYAFIFCCASMSDLLWRAFDLQFQIFSHICSFPFTWNAKSRQLYSTPKGSFGFYTSRLQVLYFFFVQCCNWCHITRHFLFPNEYDSPMYTLMLGTQALASCPVVTFSIYYSLHVNEVCAMFNNLTKVFKSKD